MQLSFLILITVFLQFASASSYAQRITLNEKNVPVTQVFEQIKSQSGYHFFWRGSNLENLSVTVQVKNADIKETMDIISKQLPLAYAISKKSVIITARPRSSQLQVNPMMITQQLNVRGRVVDEAGAPLPGVNVRIKNSQTVTATDENGRYYIQVPSPATILVFTLVGFESHEVTVQDTEELNVVMSSTNTGLDEVVVIGYGAIKKSSVTAAVSKLENEKLDQVPAGRPETALQGRIAGVNISQTESRPGEAPLIRVRGGSGSIDAGNSPLLVIDGFPGGSFANVNMNDVESIEVLKDASSAAIYGSRGAGGVIIITTRRGKKGAPTLSANATAGFANGIGHNDWLGTDEYYKYAVKYQNREFAFIGGDTSIPIWGDPRRPVQYQVSDALRSEVSTNWEDEFLSTAPFQSYNLSVNGGTDRVQYYVSGVITDEQGTLKNTWYKNYSARANIDVTVSDRIDMGLMLSPSYNKARLAPYTMVNLVKYPPFVPVQNPDGSYPTARDYWDVVVLQNNPMAYIDGASYYDDQIATLGELFARVKLADGLSLRSSFGTSLNNTTRDQFRASWSISSGNATGSLAEGRSINLLNENVLNFTKDFGSDHHLSALLGASFQRSTSRSLSMSAIAGSFNNDIIKTLNNAQIDPSRTTSSKTEWGLVSYFSRAHYAYKDRYLFSASIRTDASSRFGPDNKWGWFPSASAAWRVSEEAFLADNELISELKFRASYGTTGNFNIGNFDYLGQISNTSYSPNNVLTNAQTQSSFGNRNLSWEKTEEYDLGLELGLFNNRILLVADYYRKRTNNLLYNVSTPAILGFTSWLTNVGDVENKGIELELTSRNLTGEFSWTTSFNMARNRNKVLSLGGVNERINTDRFGMSWLLRVGEPMFSFYAYDAIGVLQNQEQVNNTPVLVGSKPGNPIYRDVNEDGQITPEDRVILGHYMPKTILGMVNDFSWKDFDLSIAIQSSLGAKVYNFENQYYQGNTLGAMRRSLVANQWYSEAERGDGSMSAAALSQLQFQTNSDIYLESASFLAIRNLNIGYTVPESAATKVGMRSLRIFSSVNNLLMVTDKGFHGYNPEGYTNGEVAGINSTPGFNRLGSEPINRVITFGINARF